MGKGCDCISLLKEVLCIEAVGKLEGHRRGARIGVREEEMGHRASDGM